MKNKNDKFNKFSVPLELLDYVDPIFYTIKKKDVKNKWILQKSFFMQ